MSCMTTIESKGQLNAHIKQCYIAEAQGKIGTHTHRHRLEFYPISLPYEPLAQVS